MKFSRYRSVSVIALLGALVGCTQKENPQRLEEKTAQTTAEVKSDAKAVAQGIREGWSRDKALDLNSATREQLVELPGVSEPEANRVIAGRPYNDPGELVTRHIMSKAEYDRVSDRITAKR
jgi:competence protein ComEA